MVIFNGVAAVCVAVCVWREGGRIFKVSPIVTVPGQITTQMVRLPPFNTHTATHAATHTATQLYI